MPTTGWPYLPKILWLISDKRVKAGRRQGRMRTSCFQLNPPSGWVALQFYGDGAPTGIYMACEGKIEFCSGRSVCFHSRGTRVDSIRCSLLPLFNIIAAVK
jgi:hypothetical protein